MEVFVNPGELFFIASGIGMLTYLSKYFFRWIFCHLKIIKYYQVAYVHGLMMTLIMDSIAIPAEDSVNTRALQHERAMVH